MNVASAALVLFCFLGVAGTAATPPPLGPTAQGMCIGTQLGTFNGDVMAQGLVKDFKKWESVNTFSTYASDGNASPSGAGNTFKAWVSDKAKGNGGTITFTASADPANNNAQCDPAPLLGLDGAAPTKYPAQTNFAKGESGAHTLTVLPFCAVGGQSLIVVTITYPDKSTGSFAYVHTAGVPVMIGTTPGANDVVDVGAKVAPRWRVGTAIASLNTTGAYTESSTFYVTVPKDRAGHVSYQVDTVPLEDPDKRIASTCKSTTGQTNDNACSHSIKGDYVDANTKYLYPLEEDGHKSLPFTVTYGCEVNGLVQLDLTLSFLGGYEPIRFTWIKECAFLPGLSIASKLQAAVNVGDIARQGDVVQSWSWKNDTYHLDPAEGPSSQLRSFFFYLLQQGDTKVISTMTSITTKSSRPAICGTGVENLDVETCTNFNAATGACGAWGDLPGDPTLRSNRAPIRINADYSKICPGNVNGETTFHVEIRFDKYLVVRFGWTKAMGFAPGLSVSCVEGCPSPPPGPILTDGSVNPSWGQNSKINFLSSTISSKFLFTTEKTEPIAYEIVLGEAVPTFANTYSCVLDVDEKVRGTKLQGKGQGKFYWTFFYWCRNTQSIINVEASVKLNLAPYKGVTYFFNKKIDFLAGFNVGTGMVSPYIDNVNSQGTPNQQGGWGRDVTVRNEMIKSLDQRDSLGKDFYVSFVDEASKLAVIPKPTDPNDPFLGLFTTNVSNITGCSPTVTTPSHPNYQDEGAKLKGTGETMHIQLRYNCDQSTATCAGTECYVKFTGQIPVRYGEVGTNDTSDKATVLFRWMKWLNAEPPFRVSSVFTDGHLSKKAKLRWRVPLSGMGVDQQGNQQIAAYLVNFTNASRSTPRSKVTWKQIKIDLKDGQNAIMMGPLGGNVSFTIDHLVNGQAYRFKLASVNSHNLTSTMWSEEVAYVPGAVLGTWAWVLIVAAVILLSTAGCFLYKWVNGANASSSKGVVGGGTEYERLDGANTSVSRGSFANSPDSLEQGQTEPTLPKNLALDNDARFSNLMG